MLEDRRSVGRSALTPFDEKRSFSRANFGFLRQLLCAILTLVVLKMLLAVQEHLIFSQKKCARSGNRFLAHSEKIVSSA